jgi:hypothetical protein
MKSKTEWFSAKQRPVRNGIYEITSDILGYECLFLCFWNNNKGWYWHLGWIITRWRGLTKKEYMRRRRREFK